ncbi:hypothetical protein, partial [Escherichia coli]|uniref:hypothetical protein n=1 Tax=Escherichia coli TaxID=562 RepID=UPI0022E1DF99
TSKTPSYTKSVSWQHHLKMNTLRLNLIHIKNNVSSNLAEILFILCTILAYIVQSIIGSCTGDGDL